MHTCLLFFRLNFHSTLLQIAKSERSRRHDSIPLENTNKQTQNSHFGERRAQTKTQMLFLLCSCFLILVEKAAAPQERLFLFKGA